MYKLKEMLNKYKAAIENLHKLAECAVCLESVKTPFKLCSRGHMMCSPCVQSFVDCPSCQAPFSIETPVAVRNLLEALPKLCRYSSEGCWDVVDSGSDHETYCGYRLEACRDCDDVVPVCELLKHYESEHPKRYFIKTDAQKLTWKNFNPSVNCRNNVPVFLYGNFFWIVATNNIHEKQMTLKFQVVPSGKQVTDYYVTIEFVNGNFCYFYTLKASMKNPVDDSISAESDKVSNESKTADKQELYCMKIPTRELKRFINHHNNLEYSLTFFKEDKE